MKYFLKSFFLFILFCSAHWLCFGQEASVAGNPVLPESLQEFYRGILASAPLDPDALASELEAEILSNTAFKYHFLSGKEQELWGDLLLGVKIYRKSADIFSDFPDLAASRNLGLTILRLEPLPFPAGEIIAVYLRDNLSVMEGELRLAEEKIIAQGGREGLEIPGILGRFTKRVMHDKKFFRSALNETLRTAYTPADHKILAGELKALVIRNQPFWEYLGNGDREALLEMVFYYCVYESIEHVLPETASREADLIKHRLLLAHRIESFEQRLALYNYFIRWGVVVDLPGNLLSPGLRELLDETYCYQMLLKQEKERFLGIKFYGQYDTGLAFDADSILQDNLVHTFSSGTFFTVEKIISGYQDFTLLLSAYMSYSVLNYESVFENDLFAFAPAVFHAAAVNAGAGVSFLEWDLGDILSIRPLCFQVIASYNFFDRIDTRDYGNILLEDALQWLFRFKYILDIEVQESLDLFFEINFSRFSRPVEADANLPLFYIGPGLAVLFRIY